MSADVESIAQDVMNIVISGPGQDDGAAALPIEGGVAEPPAPAAAAPSELFDPKPYTIDGVYDADQLKIAFSGNVSWPADDPSGQEMFAKLELGRDVELRVSAKVVAKSGRWAEKDDEATITGVAGLKIDTIYLLSPEDLS
jgi:hypothetical protein